MLYLQTDEPQANLPIPQHPFLHRTAEDLVDADVLLFFPNQRHAI